MTASDATMSDTLRGHPWVAQACVAASGIVVLPTGDGVSALCHMGRAAFVRALADELEANGERSPKAWRFVDAWPDNADVHWADTLLSQPRPLEADVLGVEQQGDSVMLSLRIPVDLQSFDVHFPELPILPGVVQLGWALSLGADCFGTPRTCRRVELLKFQRPLRPGQLVQLSMRHDRVLNRLHFHYATHDVEFSSGRLQWECAE